MNDQHFITDEQIIALQTEAGSAGDSEQWQICEDAIDGDASARDECGRVIFSAQAMVS